MKEKMLYWAPRILTILAIIFMLMFSLDTLGEKIPLTQKIVGLLMHNIPAFILTAILITAWKHELVGGILFIAAFITASIYFRTFSGNPGSLVVILPFLLTGLLFILHHILYRKPAKNATLPPSI
jgi:hypothetical protein